MPEAEMAMSGSAYPPEMIQHSCCIKAMKAKEFHFSAHLSIVLTRHAQRLLKNASRDRIRQTLIPKPHIFPMQNCMTKLCHRTSALLWGTHAEAKHRFTWLLSAEVPRKSWRCFWRPRRPLMPETAPAGTLGAVRFAELNALRSHTLRRGRYFLATAALASLFSLSLGNLRGKSRGSYISTDP